MFSGAKGAYSSEVKGTLYSYLMNRRKKRAYKLYARVDFQKLGERVSECVCICACVCSLSDTGSVSML